MLWVIIFFLIVGLLLVWAEFYVPGGIIGTAGFVCIAISLPLIFIEYGRFWGSVSSLVVVVVVFCLVAYWMGHFHRSFLGSRMMLESEVGDEVYYDTLKELIGQRGVTFSSLRPSGTAVINGRKYDVVAEVGLIDRDTEVEVVKVEGINVVVRAVEKA